MSAHRDISAANARLMKALVVVAAIVIAVPAVDAVLQRALPAGEAGSSTALDTSALVHAGSANDMLDELERLAATRDVALPEAFSTEVGLLPDARDVRVDEGAMVVGSVVDDDVGVTLEHLTAQMESRGWSTVPLGGYDGATFMKQEGQYTWVLASLMQVGSATSVVMRCA